MKKILLCLLLSLFLGACAAPHKTDVSASAQQGGVYDPWEPYNRVMFSFNMGVDKYLYKPIAKGYRKIVPSPIRTGISNFSNNLRQPYYFIQRLLQGEPDKAADALGRFFINTVFGLGGLLDFAGEAKNDLKRSDTSFAETLAVWGVPEGPYFVVPFIPFPMTVRDAGGYAGGIVMNPMWGTVWGVNETWLNAVSWTETGLYYVDLREKTIDLMDELEASSIDFYATMREMYRQKLRYTGKEGAPELNYDFDMEDF